VSGKQKGGVRAQNRRRRPPRLSLQKIAAPPKIEKVRNAFPRGGRGLRGTEPAKKKRKERISVYHSLGEEKKLIIHRGSNQKKVMCKESRAEAPEGGAEKKRNSFKNEMTEVGLFRGGKKRSLHGAARPACGGRSLIC